MAGLFLSSSVQILRQAWREHREGRAIAGCASRVGRKGIVRLPSRRRRASAIRPLWSADPKPRGQHEQISGILLADRLERARKTKPRPFMPAQPAWAAPRSVALLIAAYLLTHLGVRLWIGPALGVDDAEQALFAQHWLPTYRMRAPPLFTWALVALSPVTGVGMVVISLLRYLLLAMVLGFTYLTARRLIRDPALAALATFSITAIYVFGYYSHHDLTHTTTLSAFLAAELVRVRAPVRDADLALVSGAWPMLRARHPGQMELRRLRPGPAARVPRCFRPIAGWCSTGGSFRPRFSPPPSRCRRRSGRCTMGPAPGDGMDGVLGGRGGGLPWVLAKGTASLAVATLAYPLPFLVYLPYRLRRSRLARPACPGASHAGHRSPSPAPRCWRRSCSSPSRCIGCSFRSPARREFQERLLQPALMILPVYLFMLVERGLAGGGRPRAGPQLCAHPGRGGRRGARGADRHPCRRRRLLPQAPAASCCRPPTSPQACARRDSTARARWWCATCTWVAICACSSRRRGSWPPAIRRRYGPGRPGSGQCLAVWNDYKGQAERTRAEIRAYLVRELGAPAEAKGREGEVTARYAGSQRTYQLLYELYDAPQGDCR